jgi:hypothetical protein
MAEPWIAGELLNLTDAQRAALPRLDPIASNDPSTWIAAISDAEAPEGVECPLLDPLELDQLPAEGWTVRKL